MWDRPRRSQEATVEARVAASSGSKIATLRFGGERESHLRSDVWVAEDWTSSVVRHLTFPGSSLDSGR